MKYDELLAHVGEFGFYQKKLFFLLCIPACFSAMQALAPIFILDTPDHRCSLWNNDTYEFQDDVHAKHVQLAIPKAEEGLSSCSMYTQPGNVSVNNDTAPCTTWVYDKSNYESTVTEMANIVCDRRILRSHSNMAYFAGALVGTGVMGILSDAFGRRPMLLVSLLIELVSAVATAFSPNIYVYIVMRMIRSMSGISKFMIIFVIVMEMTGPSRRVFVGIFIEIAWCVGLFILNLIAYFVRNWQTLQLIVSVPMVINAMFYWMLPESPRWLLSRGRLDQAKAVVNKVANENKVTLSRDLLDQITLDEKQKTERVTKMFTSLPLLLLCVIVFFNWFVLSMVYYGLGLNVQNLSGDIYVNFAISNAAELAANIICYLLLDRVGRKLLHCSCMLIGGLACVATLFPVIYSDSSLSWLTIMLSMIGKAGSTGAFSIAYVYTAELYPTRVRNSGLGCSSLCARIGGMVSPYIADLGVLIGGNLKVALPQIVFGSLSVTAGLMALYLPETLGRTLPETVEDAKKLRQASRKTSSSAYIADREVKSVSNDVSLTAYVKQEMTWKL